jgi:putative intracellular protease/amidase
MATKSALVLLAEGAEEMELVISADVLRRAGVSYPHVNIVLMSFFYNRNRVVNSLESAVCFNEREYGYKIAIGTQLFLNLGVNRMTDQTYLEAYYKGVIVRCSFPLSH